MNSTGNDIESNDILDFEDNTVNLDILMNADQEYWTDRLGNKRPTIDYALRMAGFTPAGFDFVTGGVLKNGDRNKCVFNQADQTWYNWSGNLPYNVIPGSTPGEGWNVQAEILKILLEKPTGTSLVGVETTESNLQELLRADDMGISYGHINGTIASRLAKNGSRVVLVGDSLSSFFNIDTANTASIFESYLRRKVIEINPSVKFFNRAIGGKRYYDLGRNESTITTLTSSYPWYSDINKRWFSYIEDLQPDVIFIAFGMNDGDNWDIGNFQQPIFFKMMEELKTIGSNPEIVFCSNILPSTVNPSTSPFEKQHGRDAIAGWTRSFSKKAGYSLMDFHRRFKCLRDGSDPCLSSFSRKTIQLVTELPYIYTEKCSSYAARIVLTDPNVAINGITFYLSSYTGNIIGLKFNDVTQKWETTVFTGSINTVGVGDKEILSGTPPTIGTEIFFTLNGDVVTITIGVNTPPIFNKSVVRFGGMFTPVISGAGSIKLDLMPGKETPVKSELTDGHIYNTAGDGGNGLNHPTAIGSSRIYPRVLDYWFGILGTTDIKNNDGIVIDFVSSKVVVNNKFSPHLNKEINLNDALTFISGAREYKRNLDGKVSGWIFGTQNRAYINNTIFNDYTGNFKKLYFRTEFLAPPSGQSIIFSLGEGVTTDRVITQVTTDGRPRITTAILTKVADLFGSELWPLIPEKRYVLNFSLDLESLICKMWEDNHSARGNVVTPTMADILPSVISKIKFGYVSENNYEGDIILSKLHLWFE